MTVRDYLVSIVRTVVPLVVAAVVAKLAGFGLQLDAGVVEGAVSAVAVGGVYAVLRALEARWPVLGVLLGWKATPTYGEPKVSKLDTPFD